MKELVFLNNSEEPITTSRIVAEVFEKEHNIVMRAIRNFEKDCEDVCNFAQMFFLTNYTDEYGRQQPMYLMNQKGFSLLAMGFTGKKALKFKSDFFDAFEAMRKELEQLILQRPLIRQSTKFTQRKLTDAVKECIIPNARANGSTAPDKVFYMTYNKLFNKVANVPAGQRDNLTISQLIMLDQMQDVAAANIRIKAKRGANYKEIYSGTKIAVEGYAQIALVQERLQLK